MRASVCTTVPLTGEVNGPLKRAFHREKKVERLFTLWTYQYWSGGSAMSADRNANVLCMILRNSVRSARE